MPDGVEEGGSGERARNEAVARIVAERLAQADGAAIDRLCAPDLVFIDNPFLSASGEQLVWGSFELRMASLAEHRIGWSARPLELWTISDQRFVLTFALSRQEASGRPMAVLAGLVIDLEDGRVVRAWGYEDVVRAREFAGEPVAVAEL